jgi:hypothetical protein
MVLYLIIKINRGRFEWTGDYSDKSDKWTEEMKKELKVELKDDGVFYMSFLDFNYNFTSLDKALDFNCSKEWKEKCIFNGEWNHESDGGNYYKNQKTYFTNPQYLLTLESDTTVIISLLQSDYRFFGINLILLIGDNKSDLFLIIFNLFKNDCIINF